MSKFRNYLLFIVILAAAGAIIGSSARAWNTPEKQAIPVAINLPDIAKNPHALKGKNVTFIARFASRANMFKNKDEVFTSENFENFSVWNKEVKFWEHSELQKSYPTLYISKDNKQLVDRLRVMNQFDKIEITGIVESLYANMPWIRVTDIRVLHDDELDQSMASQVTRAVKFINNNEFQKAKICFEIAQERKVPSYVSNLISHKITEIESIKNENKIKQQKLIAKHLLEQARTLAKKQNFEQAATTYGKALKASKDFNSSASIHKEIAGFFIDFYRSKSDTSLLDYSVNEFKIAQKIIGQPDSDIFYALAYIETLKAKTTHDYERAELLAKKCLKINSHHYNGRKLLSDIMSCQLTIRENRKSNIDNIILPVAPKKRIKLRKANKEAENIAVQIEDLISENELLALENEIKDIEKSLVSDKDEISKVSELNISQEDISNKLNVPGISAENFNDKIGDNDWDDSKININVDNSIQNDNTDLPDFPISLIKSDLPELTQR